METRGIRGATTVSRNDREEILAATRELLLSLQTANGFAKERLAAAWFTVTPDLDAAFPAAAARDLGWDQVPLLDAQEIPVPGALPRCIRVLLLWNTDVPQSSVQHIYLRQAVALRPDLAAGKE
ncbi:MAG: chorismate mutase [Anaerolineae bacterium]|jgi:chorismate mutase